VDANIALVACIAIILLLVGLLLYKVFRDPENNLSCWQFISTRGADDQEHADIDKLGKVVALIITTAIVVYYAYKTPLEGNGGAIFLAMLGVYLAFAGGMASYSAFLRSKQNP
jgi:hypothetical protein